MDFSEKLLKLDADAQTALAGKFAEFERISQLNTQKVLDAFAHNRVSDTMFAGTSGYGYNDAGRDAIGKIYAEVFGAQAGLVRHSVANGTHALTIGLFALLRPGDVMLSVTGRPYDTLSEVIGLDGKNGDGSLADFGIKYDELVLSENGEVNTAGLEEKIKEHGDRLKVVFIQRSKGYNSRPTYSASYIGEITRFVKERCRAYVMVDNCYGEFCDENEPTYYGADLAVGSLIKNPGGGMAESGGYFVGSSRAVELCAYRLTCAGLGEEVGASLGQNKNILKGMFYAPHTVCQALKTASFASYIFKKLGFDVEPEYTDDRHDIIQIVKLYSPEKLCAFCRGLQSGSPVDSFVTPEPWDMPGYADKVIMAAGAFTQGSSIEISADGPLRYPYTAYFQGGLTYESGRYAVLCAANEVMNG